MEHLNEGHRVAVLRDGAIAYTPVIWTGHRRLNLRTHPQPQTAAPVRIRRGAIGENLPERDLVLSPDHCLFLDGKLIPAKSLINGMTIVQERDVPAVHYFHVEVEPHAVLLAEGLPVESYLDTGNRACFQNCGAALVLHPEFTVNAGLKAWETHACAPLTVHPDAVQPIWQRLADRAGSLGFTATQPKTTREPGLHLLASGRVVRPITVRAGRYVFTLPAGCDLVRLVSHATIPSDLQAYRDDWRSLGVAVSRIAVRAEGGHAEIPADHPAPGARLAPGRVGRRHDLALDRWQRRTRAGCGARSGDPRASGVQHRHLHRRSSRAPAGRTSRRLTRARPATRRRSLPLRRGVASTSQNRTPAFRGAPASRSASMPHSAVVLQRERTQRAVSAVVAQQVPSSRCLCPRKRVRRGVRARLCNPIASASPDRGKARSSQ